MTHLARLEDFSGAEDDLTRIRRHLHQNPELSHHEEGTAAFIADRLEGWGYEVTRNVGGHGVVGVLRAGTGNRAVSIRADIDALPIDEATGLDYASATPGVMHACGHDGHTTMLLGAAEYLARTRNFSGTLNLIFQPAEESAAKSGAVAMIEDGLFDRFPCDAIFGLHNHPGAPAGTLLLRSGPLMAAADAITITVRGKGGHAARPHLCIDPIVVISSIVMALQTVVSRSVDATQTAVVTIGTIRGGTAINVIAETATIALSVRTFSEDVRALILKRITEIAQAQAASWGATATLTVEPGHPPVVNSVDETEFARSVAQDLLPEHQIGEAPLIPGSEDFAHYLLHKPGCFLRLGNGVDSAALHNPSYDFNDASLTTGAALWARLAERYLS